MYEQYLTTNQNIDEGKNPHIKFKKNGSFILSTPKQEESDAEPLQQYFPNRRFVPLVEVLATLNRFTHFVDELQHPQQRYHHGKPSEATIYAGIIGIGCAIGSSHIPQVHASVIADYRQGPTIRAEGKRIDDFILHTQSYWRSGGCLHIPKLDDFCTGRCQPPVVRTESYGFDRGGMPKWNAARCVQQVVEQLSGCRRAECANLLSYQN